MSSIIPGCDSDEEVFWGPITAREIETIWRKRMANKKEKESDNLEEKIKEKGNSSEQNSSNISSNSSVQEVPCLQDLGDSNCNQKMSFEGRNGNEQNIENSTHESVGCESTLPLLEATMVINQNQDEIQNFSNSSGNNSNKDISDMITHDRHEEHVQCEPESSNQLDDSIENPELMQNIDSVTPKDVEKNNSTYDNLNAITEINQSNDVSMECSYISSSNDQILVVNPLNHNSPKLSEADSVVINSEQPESFGQINLASKDLSEERGYDTLDQSNIENIPPTKLSQGVPNALNVAENIDPVKKTYASDHRPNGDNVLQELQIESEEDCENDSAHVLKIDEMAKVASDAGANESSDEKSFVSMNSEEGNAMSSSNSQYSSSNQECPQTPTAKNKENEEPFNSQSKDCVKSRIPVSSQIKSAFIKPARLHPTPGTVNEKWLSDLKRKKIPKPKKPDYMVSPAKLGSILKTRNQIPAAKSAHDDVKKSAQPAVAGSTPKPVPGGSKTLTPRKKQYEHVKSPISQYIRTGTGIPMAKSLPVLQTPNKIPLPVTAKQTPVQKLPPKFYSSAEKLVIKPGSSSIPRSGENRPLLTPKIFKHQGRVADLKKPGEINVVTPRAVRKTGLTETSFACLPQTSKGLEVSVLEEL